MNISPHSPGRTEGDPKTAGCEHIAQFLLCQGVLVKERKCQDMRKRRYYSPIWGCGHLYLGGEGSRLSDLRPKIITNRTARSNNTRAQHES